MARPLKGAGGGDGGRDAKPPRADSTVAIPLSPGRGPAGGAGNDAPASVPPDSYEPPPLGHAEHAGIPQSTRDLIGPTAPPVTDILNEMKKPAAERIELERRAASGGMGTIEIAIDRALQRRIALKMLHPHLRTSRSAVRMFLREARVTGLLDHPHIVPVYDIGERGESSLYFSMKLVEGQTLGDMIRALPREPIDTGTLYALLDVVTKICDALSFAHSRGVVHCDVKPGNVMVGEFGQVYVMDWGIARFLPKAGSSDDGAVATTTSPGHIIGTPCYMSPEQARGDRAKLDVRSDVFLMGALLYEVVTRAPPYPVSDRATTLSLAAIGDFPPPKAVVKDGIVPPELERIILRAMDKEPSRRYPSIAALKEDLVRFMRGGADFPRATYGAGEVIVREGDPGEAAYIIVAGSCEIHKQIEGGTETIHTLGPGDVFGEMAILTEGPRTATVVATEPTTVLVVTSFALEQEMAALKPWVATLLTSLATRFRDVDAKRRKTDGTATSPPVLASQVLMIVSTFGAADTRSAPSEPRTARSMSWKAFTTTFEAHLRTVLPISIFAVLSRYGIQLDVEADRITIPDADALRDRVARELRP